MRRAFIALGAVVAALFLAATTTLFLTGCGPAVKDQAHTNFTTIAFAGQGSQIVLHFDADLSPQEKSDCIAAAYYHVTAFETQIFPVVQSAVGVPLPSPGAKDVWIYDAHHLNAPYANTVSGWTTGGGSIHVVAGPGSILPHLTKLLTLSYYDNVPAYNVTIPGLPQPSMSFWAYVDHVDDGVMKLLKFMRRVP